MFERSSKEHDFVGRTSDTCQITLFSFCWAVHINICILLEHKQR